MSKAVINPIENSEQRIILGKVNGFYGVKGYVKVFSETRPREAILDYSTLEICINKQWQCIKVLDAKSQAKSLIFLFEGIVDRTAAAGLMGASLAIMPSQLPQLAQNEYFWRDLIGTQVSNLENVSFGVVKSMMETGANDVLICDDGEKERLVPFIQQQVIKQVDLENKQIVVDWDADF